MPETNPFDPGIFVVTGRDLLGAPVRLELREMKVRVDRYTRRSRIKAFQQAEPSRMREAADA